MLLPQCFSVSAREQMWEGSRTPSSSIHTGSVHPGGKINLSDHFSGAGSARRELRPVVRKLFAQPDTFSSKPSTLEKCIIF